MLYLDIKEGSQMAQNKEVHREYMRQRRQGSQNKEEGSQDTGSQAWYPNKKTDKNGNPITPITLSDGQLFYPEKKAKYNKGRIGFIQKELNDPYLIEGIESAAKMFGDRDTRYERALRYKLWREGKGQVIDTGTLAKLSMIKDQLKLHGVLDGVLYGSSKLGDIL